MKSSRMFLKETLHICHLQNTVIEIFKRLIPCTSSSLFNGWSNRIHINDMVAYLCHQFCQNHFVDTWEAFRSHQIIHSQLFKSLMQTGFILNITCYIIQLLLVFTVKPFRNKIVAICLVWHGNKSIQSGKIFLPHRAGSSGQQQMDCQPSKIWFFLCKSAALSNFLPKCTVCMIFYKILINSIIL